MPNTDSRLSAIKHWLTHTLECNYTAIEPASNDASFRRYFRIVHPQGSRIVMDAPPEKETLKPFIKIGQLLTRHGLQAPTIYFQNTRKGFLILDDFGPTCYLDHLTPKTVDTLYKAAMHALLKMQVNINPTQNALPVYNQSLLHQELELFRDWFLTQLLDITLSPAIHRELDRVWALLIKSALEQPQVFVHRDFHSRNLMILEEHSPGIIDFQDAVQGPITYDLVSLLRDCYIAWPKQQVLHWVTAYHRQLQHHPHWHCELPQFIRWFDLMGLQRHLKAIGIFSRLKLRDHKEDYLNDIPRTLNYVINISNDYPELAIFSQLLTNEILPAKKFPS
ncbi:MAG TPA: aminoglycoside phosphotransferase [Methylococcaceae bacterium]|jgi:aminoglycoside/choline kinase family phosphotransferase|nr:aminoglycoside phosphotransferase [Methylococcaceae bacterium]HIN68557.1 aminoglycoside phosphotransferase [Methylococcales bacterium]HIA45554.1 aminoglycoside phosphotransferase [Methylococcaceae bacterium]HIB62838.1 aminoglycoside phosphotransferase [Methylococcaceae bacterium]HIO12196.1 aminoglycoside phosphotransferase [Methylococcales bacterium]